MLRWVIVDAQLIRDCQNPRVPLDQESPGSSPGGATEWPATDGRGLFHFSAGADCLASDNVVAHVHPEAHGFNHSRDMTSVITPVPERATGISLLRRIVAGCAGIATLIFTALLTLGTVLAAPVGVLAARALARRRHRTLSRGAAWLGAVSASIIAVPLVFAGMLAIAPPGTADLLRAAVDSAQAQEPKPADLPDWLTRMNPQAAQQNAVADRLASSRGFTMFFGIIGGVMAVSMLGTLSGSIGWVASMLLGYAITGRWIRGEGSPAAMPVDE